MNNIKIPYYIGIKVYEAIHVNEAKVVKECIMSQYWYVLDKEFRFALSVCNPCHDISMMYININTIAILDIHGVDYRYLY